MSTEKKKRTPLTHQEVISLTRRVGELGDAETLSTLVAWMRQVLAREVSHSQAQKFADESGIALVRPEGATGKRALSTLLAQMLILHLEDTGISVPEYLSLAAAGASNADIEASLRATMAARSAAPQTIKAVGWMEQVK